MYQKPCWNYHGNSRWHHDSRWHNSHVLVYHGPLQIATFWELRHLLSQWCKFVIGDEQESRVARAKIEKQMVVSG